MRWNVMWLAIACFGCDREPVWDADVPRPAKAFGLDSAVAVIDAPTDRVLLLPVRGELELAPAALPIGKGFAAAATTPDRLRLVTLSRGIVPRRTGEDEGPSLSLIAATPEPAIVDRYELSDPLSRIAMDPESRFAVAYPAPGDGTFVHNPNELVVVDLDRAPAPDNPVEISLRSFGGSPERMTFTQPLALPGGERRLLIVQTDRDVALVDLNDMTLPEVTIPLTSGPEPLQPAAVAVSDGAVDRNDDARIAIRIANHPNVIVVDLLPVPPEETSPQSYRALPNVIFVGGVPSDVAFVQTDGGLRLAALVPSIQTLTLVDPTTGIASQLELEAPFDRISLVTSIVGAGEDGSDVALLWSTMSPEIAFVALGSTVGKPYASIERLELSEPVASVLEVPAPNSHLKILHSASGSSLFVLDVRDRTAAPIESSQSNTAITLAPAGNRAWISAEGEELAQLDLESLHPVNLLLSRPIDAVFEVTRDNGARALVALHGSGALGATVLDADQPSLASAREYFGLLLGGLP